MSDYELDVYIPDQDELEFNLGVNHTVEQRVGYVRSLLRPLEAAARAIENQRRRIKELEDSRDSMATELRALRQKLGDLSTGDRAALEQRYEMLGKITRARNEIPHLKREMLETFKRIEDALKKD